MRLGVNDCLNMKLEASVAMGIREDVALRRDRIH
jgi:hypothetical protein